MMKEQSGDAAFPRHAARRFGLDHIYARYHFGPPGYLR